MSAQHKPFSGYFDFQSGRGTGGIGQIVSAAGTCTESFGGSVNHFSASDYLCTFSFQSLETSLEGTQIVSRVGAGAAYANKVKLRSLKKRQNYLSRTVTLLKKVTWKGNLKR